MIIDIPSRDPYSFGFTAGGLGLIYCQALAGLYLESGDWQQVRREALATNALRQGRSASSVRVEREFRQRVASLTQPQIRLLAEGSSDVARPLALLAAFKRYPVIFDFCVLSLQPKLTVFDTAVRPSDLENFFAEVEPRHPEVLKLTDSTQAKIRQVLVRILAEGGILSGTDKPVIDPVPLVPEVARVVSAESPAYLRGFLVDAAELLLYSEPQ
jgi:hypothetical protein